MKDRTLLTILALALAARAIFYFQEISVWWDAGVYVGMGKWLWSLGEAGLWEHIRPPLWPFILGGLWKAGLDPVTAGRALMLAMSLGIIALTYKIGRNYGKRTGTVAAIMMAFSPILFFLSFHLYTEIPSLLFLLAAVYIHERRPYAAGILCALSFLTKFPSGIILACLLLAYAIRRDWSKMALSAGGFLTLVLPMLLTNYVFYGHAFEPFITAQKVILEVLGCNVLRYKEWYYYGWWLIYESALYLLLPTGIWLAAKRKHYATIILFALPLAYLLPSHCRDYRYLTLVLPFAALLVGEVFENAKYWRSALVLVMLLTAPIAINFHIQNETPMTEAEKGYYKYPFEGEVWTANPIIAAYQDTKLNLIYYPTYGPQFLEYLQEHDVKNVALDNCGGGIICPPDDEGCEENNKELLDRLSQLELSYSAEHGRCWYKIFTS